MSTLSNGAFKTLVGVYTDYWSRPAPPAKTFSFAKWLFKKAGWPWVPSSDLLASNSYLDAARYHFENMFSSATPTQAKSLASNGKVKTAEENEFRSRIYRLIHKGTVFDHLMPAESRAYWRGSDRKAKLITCIVLTSFVYFCLLVAPSVLYDTFLPSAAFSRTYSGPHAGLMNNEEFLNNIRTKLIQDVTAQQVPQLGSVLSIENFAKVHAYAAKIVVEQAPKIEYLMDREVWRVSSLNQKNEAATFAVFAELLRKAGPEFAVFLQRTKLVVTPITNWPEIVTQIGLSVCIWILLSLYFSRKIEFFEIFRACNVRDRPSATVDCTNILGAEFRGRRHFHYLLSVFSAIVATCVHFYYIGEGNLQVSKPVADVVGLVPYDYRLTPDLKPISIVHWLFQFFIVFLFVLLCWEVGVLGRCLRRFQRHIAASSWAGADAEFRQTMIQTPYRYLFIFGVGVYFAILGLVKYVDAAKTGVVAVPSLFYTIYNFTIGYYTYSPGMDYGAFRITDFIHVLYFFSPLLFVVTFILIATPQAHATVGEAKDASANKKDDPDDAGFIDAVSAIVPAAFRRVRMIVTKIRPLHRGVTGG